MPSAPTVIVQSVPRMAAAAAGVSIDHALAAALGAGPDRAGLQFEPGIAAAAHLLDEKRGIAAETDLGAVGKQDGQLAGGIGAQHVAGQADPA